MDFKLKILNSDSNSGSINSITSISAKNNYSTFVSTNYAETNLNNYNQGRNVFILGSSKIGNGGELSSKYEGYISRELSNDEGFFEGTIAFSIKGDNLGYLEINFDKVYGGYASEGQYTFTSSSGSSVTTFVNDKSNLIILPPADTTSVYLYITRWSLSNHPVKITSILSNSNIEVSTKNGLIKVVRGSQVSYDTLTPNFDIVGNYGNSEFFDRNRTVENMIKKGYFVGKNIEYYMNDYQIGSYVVNSVDRIKNKIKVENDTLLKKLEDITIPNLYVSNKKITDTFVNILKNYSPIPFLPNEEFDRINKKFEDEAFINEINLKEFINQISTILNVKFYINENGYITVFPKKKDNIIVIRPNNILSNIEYSLIRNNIIKNPAIEYSLGFKYMPNEKLSHSLNIIQSDGVEDNKLKLYKTKPNNLQGELYFEIDEDKKYFYNFNDDLELIYKKDSDFWETTNWAYKETWSVNTVYLKFKIKFDDKYIMYFHKNDLTFNFNANKIIKKIDIYNSYFTEVSEEIVNENLSFTFKYNSTLANQEETIRLVEGNYASVYNQRYYYTEVEEGFITMYLVMPSVYYDITYSTTTVPQVTFTQTIFGNPNFDYTGDYSQTRPTDKYIYDKNKKVDFEIQGNNLLNYNSAKEIADDIYNKYKNGLSSIRLTVSNDNYYDTNGNLIYTYGSADNLKVGDVVEIYEVVDGETVSISSKDGVNTKYQIISNEIEYGGKVKYHLQVLEYKE